MMTEAKTKPLLPMTPAQMMADPDFAEALAKAVSAYLDANLPDLVKAAMPPSPEQQAIISRETFEQRMAKDRAAAERKAKNEARAAEKAAAAAAEEQAKLDAAAASAFQSAVPFVGKVADITSKIIRGIRIDDGTAFSADLQFPVKMGDLQPTSDGALLLTSAIELPARGREFNVRGVSLITDAGRLRIELGGSRKCGNGKAVQFPARSLVFRPEAPSVDSAAQG